MLTRPWGSASKNSVTIVKIARFLSFAALIAASTYPAVAVDSVVWDNSGNGLLSGTYNFREVMWRNNADLRRIAIYGTLAFDGNGHYTLTSQVMDSNASAPQPFSTTGAYRIAASGMGFMDDPIRNSAGSASSVVWGLVSNGIFIGSSTDDRINSLFVAALAPAAPTNASFSGSYQAVAVNYPTTNLSQLRDMSFPLNPNGQGSLGTVNLTGLIGSGGSTVTQTVNNATYSVANGALTLSFGGSLGTQNLIAGDIRSYMSNDGNFFFGGSATGWDMVVGVRSYSGNVPSDALKGMYYQAGVDVTPATGFSTLATYYGAFSAFSGTIIGHQRVLTGFDPSQAYTPFDYTYSDGFTLDTTGSHDDFLGLRNIIGANGAIQIGWGNQSRIGINVSLKAPAFNGSGTFLDPTGVASAASSAPFTVGVSRGGFIALYGTNLASTNAQNASMPKTLGGVQVLINGRQAPVYVVSPGFVSAIVPFETTGTVASIQVVNNNVASATRTVRLNDSTPGIYTNPAGGVGVAIAQHVQDNSYSTVTRQKPANPGETILVYVDGLGDVDPAVATGVAAPLSPLSWAKTQPIAVVDGEQATVGFAGLVPTLIGVYAMTVTIPSDIAPGDVYLDISLPDAYTTEAQIPVGSSSLANGASQSSTLQQAPRPRRPAAQIPGNLRRFPTR